LRNRKNRIGRNDPCPCGSSKKYKKCCENKGGSQSEIPEEVFRKVQEHARGRLMWEEGYGKIREIISADFKGQKFVAVGDRLHYSKNWRTFPDFLKHYITDVLGADWGNAEIAKPYKERHQILKWYDSVCRFQQQHKKNADGLYSCIPNGIFAAYLLLAYDLYVLRQNASLQAEVIRRLKNKEKYQSARYELYVAATCCRAGFEIQYEDETDVTKKHPEFIATHRETGQKITVEAKSRHRPGVLGYQGDKQNDEGEIKAGIGRLLRKALQKPTDYPFVIFIDLNLPPLSQDLSQEPWVKEIMDTVSQIGDDTMRDYFNLIVFTNHPHHYGYETKPDPKKDTISVFSQSPAIIPEHPDAILNLHKAALQYGRIPNSFPNN